MAKQMSRTKMDDPKARQVHEAMKATYGGMTTIEIIRAAFTDEAKTLTRDDVYNVAYSLLEKMARRGWVAKHGRRWYNLEAGERAYVWQVYGTPEEALATIMGPANGVNPGTERPGDIVATESQPIGPMPDVYPDDQRTPDLNSTERKVLDELIHISDGNDHDFGHADEADLEELGLTKHQFAGYLSDLQKKGYIVVEGPIKCDGKTLPSQYEYPQKTRDAFNL